MDSDKSTSTGGDISTNVVFVSPQADLSEWDMKTVDVTPTGDGTGDMPAISAADASAANSEPLLDKQNEPVSGPCDSPAGMAQGNTPRVVQRGLF